MANSEKKVAAKYSILEEADVPGAKLKKPPENCIVDELKRWLECHSLKKSGKKDVLIQRVKDALPMNLPVNPNVDGGKWYVIKLNKINSTDPAVPSTSADPAVPSTSTDPAVPPTSADPAVPSTSTDPAVPSTSADPAVPSTFSELFPTDSWKVFPSRNIPNNFNYGHLYFYMVESIATAANIADDHSSDSDDDLYNTCDTVTSKPMKKGRSLVKSGYVVNIQDNFSEIKQEYYIRSHVDHSMKRKEDSLNVGVIVSNVSGYVKFAECDCKASAIGRCCHIAALLLKLSDISSENNIIIQPSTSKSQTWGKGKKREKEPKKLHEAEYSSRSSKRKPPSELYNFDPRPEKMRNVSSQSVRNFVVSMQSDPKLSMWESLLPIRYENFKLEPSDVDAYRIMTLKFIKNIEQENSAFLNEKSFGEIPGTESQADSPQWHHQRRLRITASTCKSAVNLGEKLSDHDSFHPHFSFIHKKLWFPSDYTSIFMQYGKDNEVTALKEYGEKRNVSIALSGLWINKKYTHLAASPDGLLLNDGKLEGILEVKCLKILKLHSVSDILNGECLKPELKRQCFELCDGKLVLKKCHMYYYQIQLQLLITETDFCDFILYCDKGPSHVERILPDFELQQRIIASTRLFWEKVYVPEYFLMRVPRDLLPLLVE